jgi:transcriptional regulator with XRE-family HTH domain
MVMDRLAIELGNRIRKERKKCGLSQDLLALTCNLDRSYVGRIERGEVNVTIEKLYRIARTLGCEPAGLLPPLSDALER